MSEQRTEFERIVAIREGHKIHSETSYFTPRPQLDFENARHVFGEGFDRGYIAATAEAKKRIEALEARHERDISEYTAMREVNAELQANNNDLREALRNILGAYTKLEAENIATDALSTIPAESLQAHDAETIKRYADDLDNNHWVFIPHDLRKPLKEGKYETTHSTISFKRYCQW